MTDWIWAHIEAISAVFGMLSAAWAFLMRVDRTIKSHLQKEFATKKDLEKGLERIDKKMDKFLLLAFHLKDTNKEEKLKLL